MPTYEYRCPLGHEFERIQRITDPLKARCPRCGRQAVLQISGGAGLIFKGSGFYITDYGKDGKGPAKDQEVETKPEPAAEKKAEAAPRAEPADKNDKNDKNEEKEKNEKKEKKSSRKKASS